MTRLNTEFWVQSYLKRLQKLNVPAFVVARGDSDSGSVIIKLNTLDGNAKLFQREFDFEQNKQVWTLTEESDDSMIDKRLRREISRDTDLWIVEVEDQAGRIQLDDLV